MSLSLRRRKSANRELSLESLETRQLLAAATGGFDIISPNGTAEVDFRERNDRVRGTIDVSDIEVTGVDLPDSIKFRGTLDAQGNINVNGRARVFVEELGRQIRLKANFQGTIDDDSIQGHVTATVLGQTVFDDDISAAIDNVQLPVSAPAAGPSVSEIQFTISTPLGDVGVSATLRGERVRGELDLTDIDTPLADLPDSVRFRGTLNESGLLDIKARARVEVNGDRLAVRGTLTGTIDDDSLDGHATLRVRNEILFDDDVSLPLSGGVLDTVFAAGID